MIFTYDGADITQVQYEKKYANDASEQALQKHRDRFMLVYKWEREMETDTRGGLDFLFVTGVSITLFSLLAFSLDLNDLLSKRSMVVPGA